VHTTAVREATAQANIPTDFPDPAFELCSATAQATVSGWHRMHPE